MMQALQEMAELRDENAALLRQRDELLEAAEVVAEVLGNGVEISDRRNSVYGDLLRAAIANAGKPTGTPSASTLEGLQGAVADSQKAQS